MTEAESESESIVLLVLERVRIPPYPSLLLTAELTIKWTQNQINQREKNNSKHVHRTIINDAQRNDEPDNVLYFLDNETIKIWKTDRTFERNLSKIWGFISEESDLSSRSIKR